MKNLLIQTVTGGIAPEALGYCQCHEHLFIADGKSRTVTPSLWMDELPRTAEELRLYAGQGGKALVDAQPVGCGRMAGALLQASRQTGVKVIASTGFHKLDFYPEDHFVFTGGEAALAALFTGELTEGMYTDSPCGQAPFQTRGAAKAGIIKTASDGRAPDDPAAPIYTKLFRAAAAAAVATGAPLMVHLELGRRAIEVARFLGNLGVAPDQIILCHMDRVISAEQTQACLQALQMGLYLEMDTIGRFQYHGDEAEASLLAELCQAGYSRQILLGMDTTRARLKSYGGAVGLDYIPACFRHTLNQYHLGDEAFHRFMVENPARALCWKPKKGEISQ